VAFDSRNKGQAFSILMLFNGVAVFHDVFHSLLIFKATNDELSTSLPTEHKKNLVLWLFNLARSFIYHRRHMLYGLKQI